MPKGLYKSVIDILKAHGCYFDRQGNGSHEIWYSPITDQRFTVATTIKSRHTANKILKKDAGISAKL